MHLDYKAMLSETGVIMTKNFQCGKRIFGDSVNLIIEKNFSQDEHQDF